MTMALGGVPVMPTDRPQAGTSPRFSKTAVVETYASDRLGFAVKMEVDSCAERTKPVTCHW
jgi:hypothetical protein